MRSTFSIKILQFATFAICLKCAIAQNIELEVLAALQARLAACEKNSSSNDASTTLPFVVATPAFPSLPTSPILAKSANLYFPTVKCTFAVFGHFDYDTALEACRTRQASLAFFMHASEEHAVRQAIDWESHPGFRMRFLPNHWSSNLWLGVRRKPTGDGWTWTGPMEGAMVDINAWRNNATTPQQDQNCAVMTANGWLPVNCSGVLRGVRYYGGALCTKFTREAPENVNLRHSDNYCGTFLQPKSTSQLNLAMTSRKAYYLLRGPFVREEAAKACFSIPAGFLASPRSLEEIDYLRSTVLPNQIQLQAWIDLTRSKTDPKAFKWSDSNTNDFQEVWLKEEPKDQSAGDCVAYGPSEQGLGWKVIQCSASIEAALCETFQVL